MLFIILLILCISLIIIFKNKDSDYWKKRNIIQANGTMWNFVLGKCSLAEVYKVIYEKYPNEPQVGIFLGSKPALLLRNLENIQAVLANDFQSFHSRGVIVNSNDTLADNVLFIDDFARWKLIRQKLSPVFTSMKLKNMFYIIERCARDFVEMVKDNSEMVEKPFNALYTYTTASIGASIFGIDTKTKNTMDSPFLDMAWKSTEPTFKGNMKFFIANTFPKLFKVLKFKLFGDHEEFFVGVVRRVLEDRRDETDKRHDFIDICLELQKQGVMKDPTTGYELEPTVEVLAAQAFFFFIAGADTSANTMHFTLLELSNNAGILEKVHEEIDQVFGECEDKVTYNDIEKLHYLDKVLNEAMRKYPPIGLIQRKCTKDTTLPIGNVKLDRGALVILPVFGLHRDEEYYPKPDLFDPERFSAENESKLPKYGYLPFGEGNRVCIGMRFARLQVKTGLAWLLRRYTLGEQSHMPERFERSVFSLRVPNARYDLLPRTKIE